MSIAKEQLDWYFFEEDQAEAEREGTLGWQAVADDVTGGRETSGQGRASQRLYELLFGIALMYGIAVYLIWQQAEQRIALVEQEMVALRSAVAQRESVVDDGMISHVVVAAATHGGSSPLYQFETTYLRFKTSARMAALVQSIALISDMKYRELHQEFGVTFPVPVDKVAILVDLDTANVKAFNAAADQSGKRGERIVLALSPASIAARFGLSEVDLLTNDLFGKLADHVLEQAIRSREIKPQWGAMTLALQLYLQLEYGHNRAWRAHAAFLPRRHLAQVRSINLVQQMVSGSQRQGEAERQFTPTAYAVADPLIEFMVETFGYAAVPALLDAFTEHDSWETLTPALFGISANVFEEIGMFI